jgi:hypothetical protein
MFDVQMITIAILALGAVAFGALAIVREVRSRKMDANVTKIMDR